MVRCSYHDENLAGFTRRRDLRISTSSGPFRRAVAWERAMYDSIDLIFCMSEALRQSFIDDFDQAPDKVLAVGAGANVAPPSEPPERAPEPLRLLFVGKRFERKGGPTVVAAFEALRADYPEAELWIVGPTGLELDRPGITVHGRIARDEPEGERTLNELFARANAFVMPSVYEPLGVAVIEAMGYRLPCHREHGRGDDRADLRRRHRFSRRSRRRARAGRPDAAAGRRSRPGPGGWVRPAMSVTWASSPGTRSRSGCWPRSPAACATKPMAADGTAGRRLRILYLSPRHPVPAWRGDQVRVYNLVRALSRHAEVSLLSFGPADAEPIEGVESRTVSFSAAGRLLANLGSPSPRLPGQVRLFLDRGMRRAVAEDVASLAA